jgi:hypothetical protein
MQVEGASAEVKANANANATRTSGKREKTLELNMTGPLTGIGSMAMEFPQEPIAENSFIGASESELQSARPSESELESARQREEAEALHCKQLDAWLGDDNFCQAKSESDADDF